MNDITTYDNILSMLHQYENTSGINDKDRFQGFTLWLLRRKSQYLTQQQEQLKKEVLRRANLELIKTQELNKKHGKKK